MWRKWQTKDLKLGTECSGGMYCRKCIWRYNSDILISFLIFNASEWNVYIIIITNLWYPFSFIDFYRLWAKWNSNTNSGYRLLELLKKIPSFNYKVE